MNHFPIDTSDKPIRLFRSDFMEFFTHITPAVVVAIWLPVIGILLGRAVQGASGARFPAYIPAGVGVGILLWTFAEYTLHRFVFHYRPRNAWQERVTFLFHGVHHAQPQCKTRLVMPPAVSVPMAMLFYGLFYGIAGVALHGSQWVEPLVAGFMLGYLAYDLTHYATHHFPMRWGFLKYLKRHHMLHHYKTPDQRFGVSSPFWDMVFGTLPTG